MLLEQLCPPSIIFVVFLFIFLTIDLYDNNYRTAFAKMIIGFIIVSLLQVLCLSDLAVLAWMIVFLPLIIYTYMTIVIYSAFGIDPDKNMKRFEIIY
jgi:hypothetical protein